MTDMTNKGTIVIAGASGAIGRRAVEAFDAAGWTVRRYQRGTDLGAFAQGADVILNALNPPGYHNWKVEIPRITAQMIAAAKSSGATLMVPGNVYVYGDQPGPWSETTPHRPCSRKGAIRAEMERSYRDAAATGVRTILLRAGDFIDAANPQTILPMLVLKGLPRHRITALGDPAARRAYAHLPDLARAFVLLAGKRAGMPPFTEVGFPGLRFSIDGLAAILAEETGHPIRIGRFPWWAMRLASPFWELARELGEMRYLYDLDHQIDGSRFSALLPGFAQMPLREVIRSHLPEAHAVTVSA